MLLATAVIAAVTFVYRAAGSMVPRVPPALVARTSGLAPALLAALVVGELAGQGADSDPAKVAGVAVAALLAALKVPVAGCVAAGALVAGVMRAAGIGP